MKQIILIQHCQSKHHVNGMTGGWTDSPLTELGRKQAATIGTRLKNDLTDVSCRLYASDLLRASQTAQIVGEELGLKVQLMTELREFNNGSAIGKTKQWARENLSAQWSSDLFDSRPWPQAETWREFHARIAGCMDDLLTSHPADKLPIIVTHGGAFWPALLQKKP